MGTSVSYRAPETPRWSAFTTALQQELPIERVCSELFNAGQEWEKALTSRAVAFLAIAAVNAPEHLSAQIEASERPDRELLSYVSEARQAAAELEPTPAASIAERALAAVLIRSASGETSIAEQSGTDAAASLQATLGDPGRALTSYLGEVLSQYAKHVSAREIGFLTEGPRSIGVTAARRLTENLAAAAAEIATRAEVPAGDPGESWKALLHQAFESGRQLPGGDR